MKRIAQEVFVSFANAKTDLDDDALAAALASGKPVGALGVLVTKGVRGEGERKREGYILTISNSLRVELDDDPAEVDDALARDLPEIGRDDEFTDQKAGDPMTLNYVQNHDGLPLMYNKTMRGYFAKEGSGPRTPMADMGFANVWGMQVLGADFLTLLQSGKQGEIVSRWKAAGSPRPAPPVQS